MDSSVRAPDRQGLLARIGGARLAYAGVLAALLVVGVLLPALNFWPHREFSLVKREVHYARVLEILEHRASETLGGRVLTERLALDLNGQRVEAERAFQAGTAAAFEVKPGDEVLVYSAEGPQGPVYQVYDQARRVPVLLVTAVFALLVVATGRLQGLLSLAALAASVLVIGRFIVPAILGGASPLPVCIVGATVIMATSLVLGHGAGWKTAVSLAATAACLVLAGVVATWAVDLVHLSGNAEDEASTLSQLAGGLINMRGLLLGGIILGALGVLDDVTTTQASAVLELHEADPGLSAWELFRRAMRVGRDHIAATTNTLLLAYAGASLPLLVILAAQDLSPGVALSFEALATELVRTLAGSIAIVAAVPLTTALAAWTAPRR